MIAIVDYQAGNLTSVARALSYLGQASVITRDPDVVARAERVIFPGVGAAGEAMRHLRELGLRDALRQVLAAGKPFLGICLGYQVLFEGSDENQTECLGILPGWVRRFPDPLPEAGNPRPLKVPQMGWNRVAFTREHPVWAGVPEGSEFYFVHSYFPVVADPAMVAGTTEYGVSFTSGVAWQSLVAFQCHPEKSGRPGLRLLENFCHWRP